MSPQDHILNRLQRRVRQIARMVGLGSRLPSNQGNLFSPIASNFGGRKFQRAAQKMRVLTQKNPLEARAEKANTMADAIQAKFQNAQKLLHVSTAGSGFWSAVEQVFPNQAAAERTDTPLEAGELRQGSIIQQFNTVPKSGQSLESFKGQVQRSPVVSRRPSPPSSLPKKPSPKDKLFSRVQEITPGSSEKKSADKAPVVSHPEDRPSIQRQVDEPVETKSSDTDVDAPSPSIGDVVQRRAEPTSKPESTDKGAETPAPSLRSAAELQPKPVASVPPPSPAIERSPSVADRPIERNIEQNVSPDSAKADIQPKALDTTPTVKKPELTLAHAIQKKDKIEKPALARAQQSRRTSVTRDSSRTEAPKIVDQPKAALTSDRPTSPSTPPSAEPVVQRRVTAERSSQDPEPQSAGYPPRENSSPVVNASEASEVIAATQSPVQAQQSTASPEMPLKNHLQRKQVAISQMRSSVSAPVRLRVAREPLKLATLSIQRASADTKPGYFASLRQAAKPTKKIGSGKLSLSYPDLAAVQNAALAPVYAAKERVSSSVNNAIDTVTAPVYAAQEMVSSKVNSAIDTVTAPFQSARKKLSKLIGQEEDVAPAETPVAGLAQTSNAAAPTPAPTSVNDLAEKVFPLVKQLLELEMERTGGRFR